MSNCARSAISTATTSLRELRAVLLPASFLDMRRVLMLGAVALLLSACGGSDDDADVAVADPPGADAAVDGNADGDGDEEDSGSTSGGDAGGGALADSISACDLVTLEDLTGRGVAVVSGPTQTEGDFGFDECTFADESGPSVFVSVFPPAGGSGAIGDQEEIAGIGTRTVYSPAARTIIIELEDGSRISISIPSYLLDDPRNVLIELAEIAVG